MTAIIKTEFQKMKKIPYFTDCSDQDVLFTAASAFHSLP